ncbi:hypothetical protein [Defluviimonas salinarum]|uniref:Uncharacterized protein n=1 Tax=Defluviimonas salinarum TaxID=2992147 RepID=A0ABT3J4J6_9RHOB|nr:hypothetical protein [Defluviimonas salinarum]MCW3782615.1 hypothetical protein [Defluviimonas salinarum]
MSKPIKPIAQIQKDERSGIILAQARLAPSLEARQSELLDPKAIGAAQGELDTYAQRIAQIAKMSDLFDDDGAVDPLLAPPAAVSSPVAGKGAVKTVEEPAAELLTESQDVPVVIGGLDDGEDLDDGDDLVNAAWPLAVDEEVAVPAATSTDADDGMPVFVKADAADIERNRAASDHVRAMSSPETPEDDLPLSDEGKDPAISTEYATLSDFLMPEDDLATQSLSDLILAGRADPESEVRAQVDEPFMDGDAFAGDAALADDDTDPLDEIGSDDEPFMDGDAFAGDAALADDDTDPLDEAFVDATTPDDEDHPDGDIIPLMDDLAPAADEAFMEDEDPAHEADFWTHEMEEENSLSDLEAAISGDFPADPIFSGEDPEDDPAETGTVMPEEKDDGDPVDVADADLAYEEGESVVTSNAKTEIDIEDIDLGSMDREKPATAPAALDWMDMSEDAGEDAHATDPIAAPDAGLAGDDLAGAAPAAEEIPAKRTSRLPLIAAGAGVAAIIAVGGFLALGAGTPANTSAGTPIAAPVQATPGPVITDLATPAPTAVPADAGSVAGIDTGTATNPINDAFTAGDAYPVADAADPVSDVDPVAAADAYHVAAPEQGDLADLAAEIPAPEAISEPDVTADDSVDQLASIAAGLENAADGNLSDLFLEDPTGQTDAGAAAGVTGDMLEGLATKDELAETKAAIDLMFEKLNTMGDEAVERDGVIAGLQAELATAKDQAERAEALALAQNEVLVEFVRVQEKMNMAESLIVDLSRRVAAVETTDPADRVAVERSLEDLNDRLEGMARDLGLIARIAINGAPGGVKGVAATSPSSIPGSGAVFEKAASEAKAPGAKAAVPSDVKVGDFVEGYGYVLDIIPTTDGARLIVMENGSVLIS